MRGVTRSSLFAVSLTVIVASDYTLRVRGVAQLAAHRVWDAGVGGSSPPTPTTLLNVGVERCSTLFLSVIAKARCLGLKQSVFCHYLVPF